MFNKQRTEHHEAQKISQLANENEHLGTGYLVVNGTEVDGSKGQEKSGL